MSTTTLASMNFSREFLLFTSFTAFDSSGRLVVHGGITDQVHTNVERYNPSTGVWSSLAGGIQYQQVGVAYSMDGSDRLLLACGQYVDSTINGSTDRGFMWDPATNTWSSITTVPHITEWSTSIPQGRVQAFAWGDNSGHLWLSGGTEESGDQDVGTFSFPPSSSNYRHTNTIKYSGGGSGTWSQVSQHPPGLTSENSNGHFTGFQFSCGIFDGTRFYVLFPDVAGTTPGPFYFDVTTNTWTTMASVTLPSGTNQVRVVLDGSNNPYLLCMRDSSVAALGLLRYNAASNTWSTLATPSTSAYGAPVFYGTNLLVFAKTGGIYSYDPTGNAWTALTDTFTARADPFGVGVIGDGTGVYILGGNEATAEYWTPGPLVSRRGRSYAQVIGD